jgi:hypothetical protein
VRRAHYLLVALSAVGMLVSLGGPWWVFRLETGVELAVTGLEASAQGSSLLVAAAAALGLGFVLRGVWRRVVAVLFVALLAGVIVFWAQVADDPTTAAGASVTALTGLSGESSLNLITQTTATGFVWVGFASAALAVGAGLFAVVMSDRTRAASRYEIHSESREVSDPVVAWDRLSDGEDPTKR